MERLTPQQSELLQRIATSRISFQDLSDNEQVIVKFLRDLEYVKISSKWERTPNTTLIFQSKMVFTDVSITEKGKQYLIFEEISIKQFETYEGQLKSLRDLADTAIKDSTAAAKSAKTSKIISVVTLAVSIAAVIVQLLMSLLGKFPTN